MDISKIIDKGNYIGKVSDTSEDMGKLLYEYEEKLFVFEKDEILL